MSIKHIITPLRQKVTALLAAAALLTGITASAADDQHTVMKEGAKLGAWTMDYDKALDLATDKNLPVFLHFTGSDWCGWCKLMDKKVFAEEEWYAYAKENIVLVTLDFPNDDSLVPEKYKKRNRELQEKWGVQGYPTYVIIDNDAETEIGRLGASPDATAETFIRDVKDALMLSPDTIETTAAKLTPPKAVIFRGLIKDLEKTRVELNAWIETEPKRSEENMKKYKNFMTRIQELKKAIRDFS